MILSDPYKHKPVVRWFLIAIGFIAVGLGFIGLFIPVLPTTPFLLLAAGCFAHSSNRFYHWLTTHPWFGKIILDYKNGKGIPLNIKIYAISLLWISIVASSLIIKNIYGIGILVIIAIAVSWHIVTSGTKNIK